MSTYIYSKWRNSPVEFYSELDGLRYEIRKVEVFQDGRLEYASKTGTTGETRLGIMPVPSIAEIMSQPEFDVKSITKQDFEEIWEKTVNK